MLGNYDVVTFILTNDAVRAKAFFAGTLGLRFVEEDQHSLVFDAHGVGLRVVKMKNHVPSAHTVLGWEVPDVVATATEMVRAGIVFERYSYFEQDELGVWSAPDRAAKVAWFKDPDGNVLSISQH